MTKVDVTRDCEQSLRALGLETISLYWLHRDDVSQPVGQLLETLETLVASGKIQYYGCSNWSPERIREATQAAKQNHWQGFSANQPMWSLAQMNVEAMADETLAWMGDTMLAYHRDSQLPAIPYTAQARGVFAKVAQQGWDFLAPELQQDYDNETNRGIQVRLAELSRETGQSSTALALAWMTSNPDFLTIPIVSAKSLKQWEDILSGVDLHLSPEQVAWIRG